MIFQESWSKNWLILVRIWYMRVHCNNYATFKYCNSIHGKKLLFVLLVFAVVNYINCALSQKKIVTCVKFFILKQMTGYRKLTFSILCHLKTSKHHKNNAGSQWSVIVCQFIFWKKMLFNHLQSQSILFPLSNVYDALSSRRIGQRIDWSSQTARLACAWYLCRGWYNDCTNTWWSCLIL